MSSKYNRSTPSYRAMLKLDRKWILTIDMSCVQVSFLFQVTRIQNPNNSHYFCDKTNVIGVQFMYTYGRFQKTSRFCLIPKSIIDYHLLCGKGLSHQYQEGRSSILSFSRGVATWREILNIPGIEKTMYQSMSGSIRRVYPLRL